MAVVRGRSQLLIVNVNHVQPCPASDQYVPGSLFLFNFHARGEPGARLPIMGNYKREQEMGNEEIKKWDGNCHHFLL